MARVGVLQIASGLFQQPRHSAKKAAQRFLVRLAQRVSESIQINWRRGRWTFVLGHIALFRKHRRVETGVTSPWFEHTRTEERRDGKEWVSKCRFRWSPYK